MFFTSVVKQWKPGLDLCFETALPEFVFFRFVLKCSWERMISELRKCFSSFSLLVARKGNEPGRISCRIYACGLSGRGIMTSKRPIYIHCWFGWVKTFLRWLGSYGRFFLLEHQQNRPEKLDLMRWIDDSKQWFSFHDVLLKELRKEAAHIKFAGPPTESEALRRSQALPKMVSQAANIQKLKTNNLFVRQRTAENKQSPSKRSPNTFTSFFAQEKEQLSYIILDHLESQRTYEATFIMPHVDQVAQFPASRSSGEKPEHVIPEMLRFAEDSEKKHMWSKGKEGLLFETHSTNFFNSFFQ